METQLLILQINCTLLLMYLYKFYLAFANSKNTDQDQFYTRINLAMINSIKTQLF